jgi:DNA-directed RNA polymerase specialized sigma24 family protein
VAESRIRIGIKRLSEGWTLDEFERFAGGEVRRLANKMLHEQTYIPLELDDMVQVILMTIWDRTIHWDGRGSVEGYVMWRVRCQAIREMMWARGLLRDRHNKWVGAALIPMGEDPILDVEVFEGTTPDELIDAKRSLDEFIETACTSERQTVLVMTALYEGTECGAKTLYEREGIESLGIVRDVVWIQKAISRALKRAKKEYYGNEANDEAEVKGGKGCGRREADECERGDSAQGLSPSREILEEDVGFADGVAGRQRVRSRRRRTKSSALVPSIDPG